MITLITGGIKSGKSSCALEIARSYKKCAFVATADPNDATMKEKILSHQKEREYLSAELFEEKIHISPILEKIYSLYDIIILDCITVWLANTMFAFSEKADRENIFNNLIQTLGSFKGNCIIVTNEVGMGIISENNLAREYSQELGILNKEIARIANTVILMVSGIPMYIKNINK